ncbi:hypothetical protein ACLOJK_041918, partial [Asimina triloba]
KIRSDVDYAKVYSFKQFGKTYDAPNKSDLLPMALLTKESFSQYNDQCMKIIDLIGFYPDTPKLSDLGYEDEEFAVDASIFCTSISNNSSNDKEVIGEFDLASLANRSPDGGRQKSCRAIRSPDGCGQDPEGRFGNGVQKIRNVVGVVRSVVLSGSDQTQASRS